MIVINPVTTTSADEIALLFMLLEKNMACILWQKDQIYTLSLGTVDISPSEARRPAACPRDPEILINAQAWCTELDRTGSRGQAAGRRELKCQQPLEYIEDEIIRKSEYKIKLTHDVLPDKRNKDRYIILGNSLSTSSLGTVYPVDCTLSFPDDSSIERSEHNMSVVNVKMTKYEYPQPLHNIIEDNQNRPVKPATFIHNKQDYFITSYQVMKKFQHMPLDSFLKMLQIRTTFISSKIRLMITIALLNEFKNKYDDQGLNHGDIKPENIILNFGSGINESMGTIFHNVTPIHKIIVHIAGQIFDEQYNNHRLGTPGYIAPELFSESQRPPMFFPNEKADLYSIAMILQDLWGLMNKCKVRITKYKPWLAVNEIEKKSDEILIIANMENQTYDICFNKNGCYVQEPIDDTNACRLLDRYTIRNRDIKNISTPEHIAIINDVLRSKGSSILADNNMYHVDVYTVLNAVRHTYAQHFSFESDVFTNENMRDVYLIISEMAQSSPELRPSLVQSIAAFVSLFDTVYGVSEEENLNTINEPPVSMGDRLKNPGSLSLFNREINHETAQGSLLQPATP